MGLSGIRLHLRGVPFTHADHADVWTLAQWEPESDAGRWAREFVEAGKAKVRL